MPRNKKYAVKLNMTPKLKALNLMTKAKRRCLAFYYYCTLEILLPYSEDVIREQNEYDEIIKLLRSCSIEGDCLIPNDMVASIKSPVEVSIFELKIALFYL
ncbi:hypothetical protein PVAND_015679 [Polypedilum vanderplanki]|uniref:Uncharacterized protein n=1 Tax=Polypedilum vanderplanki TaxID=319348 RepID=A0A9J6BCZ2_POLVA|nr:hypothetical protein PVAND_015679 [Polypedilum vanderplanki]